MLFEEKQSKWFFKKGQYYFIVRSDSKTSYFYLDNLDMINYWQTAIKEAKEFYKWFQKLTQLRYNQEYASLTQKYDFIIDTIMCVNLPECNLD